MMFFPCIICGKEFKKKDDWDKEIQRINRLYPYLKKGVQKIYDEEKEYLYKPENPFRHLKLRRNDVSEIY